MEDKTFSVFEHPTDPDYPFRDLSITDQDGQDLPINEGITFGDFDSRAQGMWLLEREAPTPKEKAITDSVPYQQGEYDFSMLDNQRYFEVRTLTYKFVIFDTDYRYRSGAEHEIKRTLLPQGYQNLYDTHMPGYVWMAKCSEVTVEDSAEASTLTATLTFTAQPYAITENEEGADIWDDVNFDHWIFQPVKFTVAGDLDVNVQNIGSRFITCGFDLAGAVTLKSDALGTVNLNKDNFQSTQIVLDVGDNKIHLSGNGTITFKFKREEMI